MTKMATISIYENQRTFGLVNAHLISEPISTKPGYKWPRDCFLVQQAFILISERYIAKVMET